MTRRSIATIALVLLFPLWAAPALSQDWRPDTTKLEREARLWMALGSARACMRGESFALAREECEKALELDPGNPEATKLLAEIDLRRSRRERKSALYFGFLVGLILFLGLGIFRATVAWRRVVSERAAARAALQRERPGEPVVNCPFCKFPIASTESRCSRCHAGPTRLRRHFLARRRRAFSYGLLGAGLLSILILVELLGAASLSLGSGIRALGGPEGIWALAGLALFVGYWFLRFRVLGRRGRER